MASELKARLDAVRAMLPELEATTAEVNRIVKATEKFLVEETKVGISASAYFESERRQVNGSMDDEPADRSIDYHLAFARMNGVFCIHIKVETREHVSLGALAETVDSTQVHWSSCDRETKLKAFDRLPELIENIITEAETLVAAAKAAAPKVKELITDEEPVNVSGESSASVTPAEIEIARGNVTKSKYHPETDSVSFTTVTGPRVIRRRPK
jgi:hypothetical protein